MKRFSKKIGRAINLSLVFTAILFGIIICFPQIYYFNDVVKYKNFCVYYDKKIPDQIYQILDSVEQLIQQSECYNSKLVLKIFLRSDSSKYNVFPWQFPEKCIGWTIPFINNIFLHKADCKRNLSYNYLGHERSLTTVLAHEITHVLIEKKWLLKSKAARLQKCNRSSFGAFWKEEGYAEYVSGDLPIPLEEGLKVLRNKMTPAYEPHMEYFKYWLAVRYLLVHKEMSFKEILDAELNLDNVLLKAINSE